MHQARKTWTITLLLTLAGCTPTTDIVNSWAPEHEAAPPVNHLMVIAITSDDEARRVYENGCEKVFDGAGVKVTVSHDLFRRRADLNRNNVRREIQAREVDGLVTTQLAGVQQTSASLPADDLFDREAIHFYKPAVSYNYTPEVDALPQHPVFLALSNFYLIDQKALVWTAMTQTPGGLDRGDMSKSQCKALLKGLRARGYLE